MCNFVTACIVQRSLADIISCGIFVVNAYNIIHKQQYVGPFESERSMPYTDGHETSFQMCENDIIHIEREQVI